MRSGIIFCKSRLSACVWVGVVLLCVLHTTAFSQTNWQFKKEEDGIKVYTAKTPNSNFKTVKIEFNINTRQSQLVAYLMDVSKQNEWVYANKKAVLLKKINPNQIVFYAVVSMPWPIANRDYVSHITFTHPDAKTLKIDAITESGLMPEKAELIRVRYSEAHWMVSAISRDVQHVVYTVQFDPGGTLPAWLVNLFLAKGPIQTFQKLREGVNKPEFKNATVDFIKD